jgi:hypothetical protein
LSKRWPAPFGANGARDWGNGPFISRLKRAADPHQETAKAAPIHGSGRSRSTQLMAAVRATNEQTAEDRQMSTGTPSSARRPL